MEDTRETAHLKLQVSVGTSDRSAGIDGICVQLLLEDVTMDSTKRSVMAKQRTVRGSRSANLDNV